MPQRITVVDAFTDRPFAGNPAAVCVLPRAASEAWMKDVAREMNLSETAFLHPTSEAGVFSLRWLTPTVAHCGVAGTIRGWLLAQGAAVEAELSQAQVSHAQVLFACNALRGILPVRRLGQHDWPAHPEVLALRRRLADAHPAYAFQE